MARETYETGVSLCRPMYYDYPEDERAYTYSRQYMFGVHWHAFLSVVSGHIIVIAGYVRIFGENVTSIKFLVWKPWPKQSKFENVDLFASLNAVMKQNTGFYQSDLEIDKEIIAKAAASPRKEDKTLLWFCRPSGTHCFRERDVFLKDTAPHNTWRFYMEQTSDRVLAYAIELTGKERGKIKGNLYAMCIRDRPKNAAYDAAPEKGCLSTMAS